MAEIFLGTIALEPNRWSTADPARRATIVLSDWLDRVADAGFDGIELWEPHLRDADKDEAAAILTHPLPIAVFNTYVSFDDVDDGERNDTTEWVRRSGAAKVKWNTGTARDDTSLSHYGERLARFAAGLPSVRLTCECHHGSAMDDPAAAARVLAAGGGPQHSQALVHSNDGHDRIREKFAAYGDRITHVHVNHLDTGSPRLTDIRDDTAATAALLDELGFTGTWTIEFVNGTGAENDHPELTLAQAIEDLAVLREVLS